MKIADVRCTVHRIEAILPLQTKPSRDSARIVCEIETEEGLVGVGMSARFLPHAVAAAVTQHLAPKIKGMDPRQVERIHAVLNLLVSERGHQTGINLSALSAIDLACWDLVGKAAGRPVAEIVGGHSDHADVYVTFGFGNYDDDELVEVARMLIAEGHRRLKTLVGVAKDGWHGDVRRVRLLREAIGPDILLGMDANESIPLDTAVRIARAVEEYDIAWFEDPVRGNDARDLARLRRSTAIPISAGQMDGHARRFRDWLEHDAIDIFMPNSLFNGGMTETRRVAALAQIYNRPISDAGGGGIYSLHHVAGFRGGTYAECHLSVDAVERQLFVEAPHAEAGRIRIPARPGFGFELNRDVLKDSLVRPT
jgi:L-alanine-DL-glutamate epimerase-like enolase superfamily enzyme